MRDQMGDEEAAGWLDGMAANDPPTYDNNTAIVEAVGRGEIPMGLVNHYYLARPRPRTPTCRSRTTTSPTATSARADRSSAVG